MAANALQALRDEGFVTTDVVAATVYLRSVSSSHWPSELQIAWGEHDAERLPCTFVIQPPATPRRFCEMHLHAIRPRSSACSVVWRGSPHGGRPSTTVLRGGLRHLRLFSIAPQLDESAAAADRAADMFAQASHALTDRGLSFRDVVRTWIWLPDMSEYTALNQGRNRFFQEHGLARLPASTGISGTVLGHGRSFAMDVYAVGNAEDAAIETMHAKGMGEAPAYGSAFARGTVINEPGRRLAYVSGTASIDARGRVVSSRDLRGQLHRMFENTSELLAGSGLSLAQTVSATVYLKRATYLREFHTAARRFGLPSQTPLATVVAEVCRPAWLCEIELVAAANPAGKPRG
jgi:enamine deaminase RidA (YjgF/YER057c/UK114 family)